MRGRKGKSNNPSAMLSAAIYMGLVALVRIARNRSSKKTRKFCHSIEKIWASARESMEERQNLSPVQNAEPNMRGQFLKFVWSSTKRFGNREFKRVYSWLEGTVGPLNALLNYAGARLRDIAMALYPFPKPQAFQIREYPDGSKKVFTKEEADNIIDDGAINVYWKYGYKGKGEDSFIFLSHPTLPGLDFVDMIRVYCVELCRQCFINHVPRTEAHRYIRLLIHRLKPFLDWVYTDGQEGRRKFNPDADQELRKIVLEIHSLYKKRHRTRQRITKRRGESSVSLSIERIRKQLIQQLEKTTDQIEQEALLKFLDYLDTALVADGDVEKIIKQVREKVVKRLKKTDNKIERAILQRMLDYTDKDSLVDRDDKTPFEQIREWIITQVSKTSDTVERRLLLELLDYLDINAGVVAERDIEKLVEQILPLSQREGNEWHRVLFSDLHHPVSLRQVVFSGDKMLDSLSPILVVAELPVAKHSGQVDLTIFIRREIKGQILWTPVMILEVKTKTAFDFNLYGLQLKRKRKRTITPAFYAWKRTMNEEEWRNIITSGPGEDALDQLGDYEHEILAEYRQMVTQDSVPPSSLWKGVIVLDTDQSPIDIYPAFQYLLEELMTGFIHQLVEQDSTISIAPEPLSSGDNAPKVALFITPSKGPARLLDEMESPTSLAIEDPFSDREPDDRTLTLYVSIPSPTSSGMTAARLSRNWHLLHHLKESQETSPTPIEFVWVDFMGDYGSDGLLRKRFGIDRLHKDGMISQEVYRNLTDTLWSIRFLDLSTNIDEVLTEGMDAFDKLCKHITTVLPGNEDIEYIVVLDGWEDLRAMVPGHQQNLVRTLEQRLLDALPQSNINIIWIDSGTPHTRMNIHYQRKCISPLRYDSPRRTHLDEIIYNIPTTPRRFWWVNPQQEDVRIIIQDTPSQADPWKVAIHAPQLIGFAEKFRGLARRDGIVAPEDVAQDITNAKSMYGKGVTLSSIYASTGHLSDGSLSEVLDNALTLVPSVLRLRGPVSDDEQEETPPVKDTRWQSAIQTVSSVGGSTMGERIELDVTRPPPRPRGTDRYIDTLSNPEEEGITRPWHYDRTPTQFPQDEDESSVSTHPPVVKATGVEEIDTIETRERELRRLHYATKSLKDQTSCSKELRDCCKRIERFCVRQFSLLRENPSLRTPEFFHSALLQVRKIILEDPQRFTVWKILVPYRQGLFDLLNSDNRLVLKEVMERTPDVLLLYGSNLFLAVLVALGEGSLSLVEHLWNPIAEWTFYQLGMNIHDDKVRSVYSFQAILSNLRSRVKTLSQLTLPERTTEQEQVGALFWEESEFGFNALLLIPHEDGFLTGFIEGLGDRWIPAKWHSCVTVPQRLKEFVGEALTSTDATPLVVTTVLETKVLWVPMMDEYDELQWASFILEHGKPGGRWNIIPWLKLETTVPLAAPSRVPTIPDSVDETIKRLARVKHRTIPVELVACVNKDLEVYEVILHGASFKERREFTRTNELVQFLRTPVRKGTGYRSHGTTLTWDHQRDILYDDPLSFLIPLVHRSRFYPEEFHYPGTCKEILASTTGNEITMVILQEDTTYRIEFEDLPQDSSIRGLEDIDLDVYALGLLTECAELYDPRHRTKHPVTLNVGAIMDIKFSKLYEYSRLEDALQAAWIYRWEEREGEEGPKDVIEKVADDIPMYEDSLVFRYKGLEIRSEVSYKIIVVFLESEDGNDLDVYVVNDVYKYLNDSQFAGAIHSERVDTEVNESLAPYEIEEDDLEVIRDEVKQVLMETGVRFYEE